MEETIELLILHVLYLKGIEVSRNKDSGYGDGSAPSSSSSSANRINPPPASSSITVSPQCKTGIGGEDPQRFEKHSHGAAQKVSGCIFVRQHACPIHENCRPPFILNSDPPWLGVVRRGGPERCFNHSRPGHIAGSFRIYFPHLSRTLPYSAPGSSLPICYIPSRMKHSRSGVAPSRLASLCEFLNPPSPAWPLASFATEWARFAHPPPARSTLS